MTGTTRSRWRWPVHGAVWLATVILAHLATVWTLPHVIMWVLMDGPQARSLSMHNQAAFPPPVSAKVRTVVMPSPDLLYSVCAFDIRNGPVRIRANPRLSNYWSIALYGANSDNFFVVNDRQTADRPVDLLLVAPGHEAATDVAETARRIVSPSSRGFLLMRVLTSDYDSEKAVVETARHSLTCSPV